MKKLLLALILLHAVCLFGQSTKEKNDSVFILVQKYFNAKNTDSLYALSGSEFKKALTLDQFKSVCDNNLYPLGTMNAKFESFTNGVSKYKATFTSAVLAFYLSLDNEGKLYTFLFKPILSN